MIQHSNADKDASHVERTQRIAIIKSLSIAGKFQEALNIAGLSVHSDVLSKLVSPALRMKLKDFLNYAVGSKVGGIPDVPPTFEWPMVECEAIAPLEFLCQIDLDAIHKLWSNSGLPITGMLSFFADASEFDFGGNPSAWKVFWFRDKAELAPAKAPSAEPIWDNFPEETFSAYSIDFEYVETLPDQCSQTVREINMTEEEQDRYDELLLAYQGEPHDTPTHQLLGHPQLIQQDLYSDCDDHLQSFDIKYQNVFPNPSKVASATVNDWCLLLQISSDDLPKFCWGDNGKLYFCIRKGDLENRIFDRVMLVGQCF